MAINVDSGRDYQPRRIFIFWRASSNLLERLAISKTFHHAMNACKRACIPKKNLLSFLDHFQERLPACFCTRKINTKLIK